LGEIAVTHEAEFEALGVDAVRARVEKSVWDEAKLREARIWLESVSNRTDRSAKNAAWIAAIAAIIMAICAIVALIPTSKP
jgi:hypothetical protein